MCEVTEGSCPVRPLIVTVGLLVRVMWPVAPGALTRGRVLSVAVARQMHTERVRSHSRGSLSI